MEGTSNHETDIKYDLIREKCLLLAQALRRIEEEGERQLSAGSYRYPLVKNWSRDRAGGQTVNGNVVPKLTQVDD